GRRKWIASFARVIDEGVAWASVHRSELAESGVRTERYFERFRAALRAREFALEAPGRFEWFAFLLRRNWIGVPVQSWRGTAVGLMRAFEGLAFGYRGRR